jgi:hypothetical protein
MSQENVERILGRLVTDEGFRRRFAEDPDDLLLRVTREGVSLTAYELRALAALDATRVERFAREVDPRIQKTDLDGEST